ncbi:MAG TPA: rhodanese-like domain-containing protein [Candidatus Dormibacteraeota bacterium]|nr:rhodanese-like domain-containing protein [Candidatus Dormibacteraeota bacterium]
MFHRPAVPTIDVREAHARLAEVDAHPLLIDVRGADEFVQARVPGSVLVPLPSLAARLPHLPTDRELLVICHTGNRSATATAFLLARGYDRVADVAGGIVAWYRAGLPLVGGALDPGEGELPG